MRLQSVFGAGGVAAGAAVIASGALEPGAVILAASGVQFGAALQVRRVTRAQQLLGAARDAADLGRLAEARDLLRPSEQGDGFERSYYEALQRMPDVVLAHAQ